MILEERRLLDGSFQEFTLPTGSQAGQITASPDGNLWFTESTAAKIGQITLRGAITEFSLPTADRRANDITAGPGGNLWFTEFNTKQLGQISPAGAVAEFSLPGTSGQPRGIAAGSDGNLWFSEPIASQIGRMTPTGTERDFSLPEDHPSAVGPGIPQFPGEVAAGPDGNLWFTEYSANKIGQLIPGIRVIGQATVGLASSATPSVIGQAVTFTATVTGTPPGGSTPTGTVTFQDGPDTLGTAALSANGTAVFTTTMLASGTHAILAVYSGDMNFTAGTSAVLLQTVLAPTTTSVTSSATPSVFGQAVTFTATVTAAAPGRGMPSGTVQFQVDGNNFGSPVALNAGQATSMPTSTLSVGVHTVQVVYSGDSNFVPSTGKFTQTVNPAAASVVIVSGLPASMAAGTSASFTVTVQDANGNTATGYTGTVRFTSSDGQVGLPADYTFVSSDAGVHPFVVTLRSAGSQSIAATDTASGITGTTAVVITPAPVDHFALAAPSETISGASFDVTVTALDPYGNTAPRYQGTVHFTTSDTDSEAILSADFTFGASDQGVHTFAGEFTLVTAEM
jgi:streptogramin lyase